MKEKIEFYKNSWVASTYNYIRYGGKSGRYINSEELEIIKSFINNDDDILDIPSGPGRLALYFENSKNKIFSADMSFNMLKNLNAEIKKKSIICSIFQLPFRKNTFKNAVCLKFLFHCKDIEPALKKLIYVIDKSGNIIFQTYRWSPIAFDFFCLDKVGGRNYVCKDDVIIKIMEDSGCKLARKVSLYILPVFLYRFIPLFLIRFLKFIEKYLPEKYRISVFWWFKKDYIEGDLNVSPH